MRIFITGATGFTGSRIAGRLDAAIAAGAKMIVHVSTNNVFGSTDDAVADEGFQRDLSKGFMSTYDETKYLAHQEALKRIGAGAAIVIVQPGAVYPPGDHSEVGNIIDQTRTGNMKLIMFPEFTLPYVYVDDLADGIVLALDKGRTGGKLMGFPPNLGELIRTSDGVRIRVTDAKARSELGYDPRPLREGLKLTLQA